MQTACAAVACIVLAACETLPEQPTTPVVKLLTKESCTLPDDTVQCLYRDRGGRVWVGTATGLACYANNEWSNQIIKSRDQVLGLFSRDRGPMAFHEDRNGRLHMAGRFGIRVLVENKWRSIDRPCPVRPDILLCDSRGSTWAAVRNANEVWRLSDGVWQVALERIVPPLDVLVANAKLPSPGPNNHDGGIQQIVEDQTGSVWIAARVGPPGLRSLNPSTLPRTSTATNWTRTTKTYRYDFPPAYATINGAAPFAPLYIYDGKRWKAPRIGLRLLQPSLRHDGTLALMTNSGPADPKTLERFSSDAPADALATLVCRVHAHGGGEWLIARNRVVRSSQGECYELSLSDNDLSKLTAIINGFVCGLDDGNGNLWLGSKDAGLLQLTHTPVR